MSTKLSLLVAFCIVAIPAGSVYAVFNTVGEYDPDDAPHNNQVDQDGVYESHEGNAGPENVVGIEVFRELVAAAFLIDAGGVNNLEEDALDGQDIIANFGVQGTKSLTLSNTSGTLNVGSSVKNGRRAISGSHRFAKSGGSEFAFDIGAITGGSPGERITYVAATMLDRDGTALNPSVTATFSGGGTVTVSAAMTGDPPSNDQDTFFGFVAPPDESIVNVTFSPNGFTNLDDLAFITSDFSLLSPQASRPFPESGATDVPRDEILHWTPGDAAESHDLYFGTDETAVAQASPVNPLGVLVSANQESSTYAPPERFDFGATYYWRVDELNDQDPDSPWQGEVWSFTVEPVALPITNIAATASSVFGESGPERTIDGSGLAEGLHGTSAGDMWFSTSIPATIEYAFDRVYKLHELWIWNSNQLIESFVGFGGKDVVIEHSLDGENWTVLDGVARLAQAPGTKGYAHNNTIDLGGAAAQHVRMTINSVQGPGPQASLSEVRFFYIPVHATRPNPETDATDVAPDVTLSWGRDGREAGRHDVYVGADSDNLPLAGSVNESSFDTLALDLQLGQTYSWRVDEVNEAMDPSIWMGDVWSFTTVDAISVDDMESYADAEFLEIWATWMDGFDDPANGSLVGNGASGSPETDIVHGGGQSMPLKFDNSGTSVAEATRTFDTTQDWTRSGIQTLVLYFRRGADNTGGDVYVKINDTKVVNQEDPVTLPPGWDVWTQWNIDLAGLGTDLTRVRSLTIGVEGAGATGVLYVDDIQLEGVAADPGLQQVVTWFEAEAADLMGSSWQVVDDPTASGGIRIGSEDGDGNDNNAAPGAEWVASYTITVAADGVYGLALRGQEAGADSFWVRIVGATNQSHEDPGQPGTGWVKFNGLDAPDGWAWDQVHSNDHDNAEVTWTLPAGSLTLEIAKREDGTYLDAIAVLK